MYAVCNAGATALRAGFHGLFGAGKVRLIALDAVAEAISRLRYGAIELTVHDGRVVQLEVTERQRFT